MKATDLFGVFHHVDLRGQDLEGKEVLGIINDSRKAASNYCFIAIRGEHFDGHNAVEKVIQAGVSILVVEVFRPEWEGLPASFIVVKSTFRAQAVLANYYYGQPTTQLDVVAITGTNGKTTTSSMINYFLEKLEHKTGLLGTLHYKVDKTIYPAVNTTPEALRLQGLFAEMVEAGCQDAIIEASSHALYLGRLWYTEVDCAIFTNLSREHLDFHKTMEEYAYAKSLLFSQLGQSLKCNQTKLAILNMDDAYHHLMGQVTSAEIMTYSLKDDKADVYASHIESVEGQTHFSLHYKGKIYQVKLKMLGQYNVANFLAAFTCLVAYYEYKPEQVLEVAESFQGVEGRMQVIDMGQEFQIVVDFAHTPDALENILKALSQDKKGNLVVLFGHSGGNRDAGARPQLGDILFRYADKIILTADNPRHESVQKINEALIGNNDGKEIWQIEDRKSAIHHALSLAQAGDTLVFAGKGGEAYQVIGDEYLPYDEVEVIKNQLIKREEK